MIVRVVNKVTIPLPRLFRLVLKYIYNRKKMRLAEIHQMQDAMIAWTKKLELDTELGRVNDHEAFQLAGLGWLLKKDEAGDFEARKASFKRHGIDYRKFYRLPEAYDLADFVRGEAAGLASDRREGIA